MALNEEQKEQNQQTWQSRIARERQDLSVSVEEALDDPILQELFWSDDDGASSVYPAVPDKGVFPPRLSLQSRVIAAMQPDEKSNMLAAAEDTASARDSHSGNSSGASGVGGRYTETSAQQSNDASALTRFAQRLTSSFSALHAGAESTGTTSPQTPLMANQALFSFVGQKASSLAAIADIEVCTASTTGELVLREVTRELSSSSPPKEAIESTKRLDETGTARVMGEQREGYTGTLARVRPIPASQSRAKDAQEHEPQADGPGQKNRLAGRNTRVRLEVVPGAQGKQVQSIRERARNASTASRSDSTGDAHGIVSSAPAAANVPTRSEPNTQREQEGKRERVGKTGEQMSLFTSSWNMPQGFQAYSGAQAAVRPPVEPRSQSGQAGAYTFPHGQTSAHAALRSQTGAIPPVRRDRSRTNTNLSTLRLDPAEASATGVHIPSVAPPSPIPQPEKDTAPLPLESSVQSAVRKQAPRERKDTMSPSGVTNAHVAAPPRHEDDEARHMTWGSLQAVAAYKGMVAPAARGALSGSGYFEEGQGAVTIANPYVTERSVVVITLTSNPGPVVVQYVSLQPQVGFTAHLSAPATMRTSFNYILLLGELF